MSRKILFGLSYFSVQVWLGASIFLSFIMAPILFANFGAEIAADVMGAVFPVYGYMHVACAALAHIGLALAWRARARIGQQVYAAGFIMLTPTFVLACVQAFHVFPRSHALRKIVKEGRAANALESVAPQMAELMSLHKLSIGINNATIIALVILAWIYYRVARDWDKA